MKILFRCDSSYSIGSGHLIRCINLARQLPYDTVFISRQFAGNINNIIVSNQFRHVALSDVEGYSVGKTMQEVTEITPYLVQERPDVILVDHYGLDNDWELNAKRFCRKLVAIDDLGRMHNSHAILDQNYRDSIPENYLNSPYEKLFMGPEYCLLGEEFHKAIPPVRNFFKKPKKILVFFGGSDEHSFSLRLANIANNLMPHLEWHIVIGSQNKDQEQIRRISTSPNIILHFNINYMSKLMANCDLFLGAGGTTTWERAKLGLPSIVISVAKNQEELCKILNENGIIHYLGRHSDLSDVAITSALREFLDDCPRLEKLSTNSLNLRVGEKTTELIDYLKRDT